MSDERTADHDRFCDRCDIARELHPMRTFDDFDCGQAAARADLIDSFWSIGGSR